MIITQLLNIIHLIYVFAPFILLFIKTKLLNNYKNTLKSIFLIYFLTPLHWEFIGDKCIFTLLSIKMGDYQDSNEEIAFTENKLKWLYKPIMTLIGLNWNNKKHIIYMIYLHWIAIFIVLWYILSYRISK